jgi:hypothetical protein
MGLPAPSMTPMHDIERDDVRIERSSWNFVKIQEELDDAHSLTNPHLRIKFTIQYHQSVSSTETLMELHMTKLNFLFIMYGMCTEVDVIDPKNPGADGPGAKIRSKLLDMGFKIPGKLTPVE